VIIGENTTYSHLKMTNAPYLLGTIKPESAWLTQYYGTAHASLGNYIAQISGQGPNVETQSDCQFYDDFVKLSLAQGEFHAAATRSRTRPSGTASRSASPTAAAWRCSTSAAWGASG